MVGLHLLLPAHRAHGGVFGRELPVFGIELFYTDLALLLTGGGNGQMHPHESRGKAFILDTHRGPNANAVGKAPLPAHHLHGMAQAVIALAALSGAFGTAQQNACAPPKGGHRLAHAFKKAVKNAHFAVHIDPADLPGRQMLLPFLLGVIRHAAANFGQRLLGGKGIIRGQAHNHLTLGHQAAAQSPGQRLALQAPVDQLHRPGKIAVQLAA